jgi:hypothetical protein
MSRWRESETWERLARKNGFVSAVAQRKCLRCTQLFKSEWVGNRICWKCSHAEQPCTQSRAESEIFHGPRFTRNIMKGEWND